MLFNQFKKYYKKTIQERREILFNTNKISKIQLEDLIQENIKLALQGDLLIENFIMNFEIPLGIATGFLIDGKQYVIPLVTEEPSVIAAASNAASIISQHNGFKTVMQEKYLIGEIAFESYDKTFFEKWNLQEWIEIANQSVPSLIKRGGGVRQLYFEEKEGLGILYVVLDACEAMGANLMNTVLEELAFEFEKLGFKKLMAILSNYYAKSIASATFKVPVETFGLDVCEKIVKATQFAKIDIYRATTHNKGVMNGITAFVLATGNDTRAIEAAVHTYANGKPITNYYIEEGYFIGEIHIPLNLGTVGGAIKVHPAAQLTHQILDYPNAKTLCCIAASVGLAQNLAALKALVTKGIQEGHMKLHYKSMIIAAGGMPHEVDEVLSMLKNESQKNSETIKKILEKLRDEK